MPNHETVASRSTEIWPAHLDFAKLHDTRADGVSQSLQRGTRNGITKTFAEGATCIRRGAHRFGHRTTF